MSKEIKSYSMDETTLKKLEDIKKEKERPNDSDTVRYAIEKYWDMIIKK